MSKESYKIINLSYLLLEDNQIEKRWQLDLFRELGQKCLKKTNFEAEHLIQPVHDNSWCQKSVKLVTYKSWVVNYLLIMPPVLSI